MTQSQNESTTETNPHIIEEPKQKNIEEVLAAIKTLSDHNNKILTKKYPDIAANLLAYIHQNMDETDLTKVVFQEAFLRALKPPKQLDKKDLKRLLQITSALPPKQRAAINKGLTRLVGARADQDSTSGYDVVSLDVYFILDDPNTAQFLLPLGSLSDDSFGSDDPSTSQFPPLPELPLDDSLQQHDIHTIRIRIDEDPLTVQNLNTTISTLTELSTKYWLIAKGRYADLIEYTQTRNNRYAEEANAVITKVSYNSPFNMDWKVDLSAPSVADALKITIDTFSQRQERLEKAQLENQAKAQEIKKAEQKAKQDKQKAELEHAKQQLELEKQRLELLSMQLDIQKKSFETALELAGKAVDILQPGLDPATRAMAIQTILPNLIQLDNVKGLGLAIPTNPENTK